jgi:hypothetical protein
MESSVNPTTNLSNAPAIVTLVSPSVGVLPLSVPPTGFRHLRQPSVTTEVTEVSLVFI